MNHTLRMTNTSSLAQIVRERRSIKKKYKTDPVPQELVFKLLNDAVYAPNHGNREPWRFVFVPTEKKEKFIERLLPAFPQDFQENRRNYFSQPSAILIVIMPNDPRQKQWEENFGAVSSMIQNFQLLAWEQQLGVVWKTNAHIYEPKAREIIGVNPGEKIVGFLHMGYFHSEDIPKTKERTPVEEKMEVFE
ncbi:nitroreductase family protein [Salibacterium salarium]|nr:nitroreductase [Salibacterium salarium]